MINFKLLLKKINKSLISINELIESFFNRVEKYTKTKKKSGFYLKNIDKGITITVSIVAISILSYFLIPTFYNKSEIKAQIINQIKEKYNISGIPVVESGSKKLVGIITNRDIRFARNLNQKVESLMTKENCLVR